ncbi:hypothetical protein SAV14893_032890 [Streptomyces avermitilis]|uniref:Molecular chaperone Hsp90 n=1 Tax=Streptomyces avermitilis TaxID=33903 RepID=A0A4D4LWU3_STRAX|nr:hypothetical protein SAV14893_032890 [Streptomyces avermitilis]
MSKFVRPAAEGADPFGTARLRRGVLDAWAISPARFREDANAEEDLVLGGYRDRLVVELAQNAADAAARSGVPGRLRLTLRDGVLAAANTGAPLDAAGVESLSTLRASAKREGHESAVGRFGVGFAAVLSVTDEPAVLGRHGGVRWSLAEARELAADTARHSPGLGDEVRRRDGHVPLLRLPFAAEGTAPETYDTVVVLPLRDTAAEDLAERLLTGIDDALLLALPGLEEVVVEVGEGDARTLRRLTEGTEHGAAADRTGTDAGQVAPDPSGADRTTTAHRTVRIEDTRDGTTRWRTVSQHGPLAPELLAGRSVEERLRPHWSVTWAVPLDSEGVPAFPRTAPVVHAPTPSDEPLGVPALLIASLPLDTSRRHAAPGPLTDFLVERAADAYAGLLAAWRPVTPGIIGLVPGPLGKGVLDGALRQAILDRLPRTAFLPPAAEGADRQAADRQAAAEGPAESPAEDPADWDAVAPVALRPRDAEVVEGAGADTVRVLAEVLPSLLPAGLERRVELRTLGVARVPLTEAVDRLAGLEKDPGWWRRLYDSLAGVDPDRLSGLPVPLADGRTTIGPRQVLLPTADGPQAAPEALARLGLKVAHPEAAHPLLEKLGALPATPRAVLTTLRCAPPSPPPWTTRPLPGTRRGRTPRSWPTPSSPSSATRASNPATSPGSAPSPSPTRRGSRRPRANSSCPAARSPASCGTASSPSSTPSWPTAGASSPWRPAVCSPTSPSSAPRTSSSTRTNWSPATPTSRNPMTPDSSTPSTCGARTSWTGCPTRRCRRSPRRSSRYATWTSSTTTAGPRPSPCCRGRRCGTR